MPDATLWKLAQEVVYYLLLLFCAFFALIELVVVNDTSNDLLLLDVEIILRLLKGSPQAFPVLEGSSLDALSLLQALLPGIELLT